MRRLIDANALKVKGFADPETGEGIIYVQDIDEAPTVDAVEVVRCKDCVSYEEQCPSFGYCYHWDYEQGMSPNQVYGYDFCSYGERKDNERKAD